MKFGQFKLSIIRECLFKLDGGAMFGVVPKSMWEKSCPADEDNRILLTCNLLLIETPDGKVLVETGMGNRWTAKEIERFGLQPLVDHAQVLASAGVKNEEIDAVIISHLHFDHAGGATRLLEGRLVPTYPRAKYYIQRGEWELAHNANARARASYRFDDFLPLAEHGVLKIIDGSQEILPGIFARVTGGHTSHHQVVVFESAGSKGVFFADIMPTRSHLPPAWVMGYDHFPLESCNIKSSWLSQAAEGNWLVVFDHEPGIPWGHVKMLSAGKFSFQPLNDESVAPVASLVAQKL